MIFHTPDRHHPNSLCLLSSALFLVFFPRYCLAGPSSPPPPVSHLSILPFCLTPIFFSFVTFHSLCLNQLSASSPSFLFPPLQPFLQHLCVFSSSPGVKASPPVRAISPPERQPQRKLSSLVAVLSLAPPFPQVHS